MKSLKLLRKSSNAFQLFRVSKPIVGGSSFCQIALVISAALAPALHAQVSLPTAGYLESFNSIGSGLPAGWTTRTNATSSSLGVAVSFNTNAIDWANTGGSFKNLASSVGLSATSTAAEQAASTNRSLGVRPTGSFGDPGAAFTLQIADTVGKTNFALSFSMQMLSVQTRTNIWSVQLGLGSSPTNFVTLTNYTDPRPFGSTTISVPTNALAAIAEQSQNVWIRVANLTASTGGGSRDTVGIDDFQLTYDISPDAPNVTSISPSSAKVGDLVTLSGTNLALVTSLSFNGVAQPVFTASATQITAVVPPGASSGPVTFSVGANTFIGPSLAILSPVISSLSPDAGIAGDLLTILGSNLVVASSVTFQGSTGSIAVTPTAASDTSIVVQVPVGVVTGPVTVTTPSGVGTANFRVITPIAVPYGPESFTNGFGQWFSVNSAGTANWAIVTNAFGGGTTNGGTTNTWAQINGFGSDVPANDWLVIGPVNFSTSSNPVVTFDTLTRFAGGTNINELSFKVSTNYTGVGSPATNGGWSSVSFAKPSADLVVTPSGFVFVPEVAGQSNVWLAFHYQAAGTTASTTALWQVDNVAFSNSTLVPLGVSMPSAINEGTSDVAATVFAAGTNLAAPLEVSLTSSDATGLKFKADTFSPAVSSLQVTIPEGTNSATFYLDAPRDYAPASNKTVTVSVTTTNSAFQAGSGAILLRNIDYPSADIGTGGYLQNFTNFTSAATLPLGWTLVSTNGLTNYTAWGDSTTGPKFSAASTNVFGYQHASSTGSVQQILTLKNTTGSTITNLVISYNGRMARPTQTRYPAYSVSVGGSPVRALDYSTADGDNLACIGNVFGLAVEPNQTFEVVWTSDRGTGTDSSRQIGISDVVVTVGTTNLPPVVRSLTIPAAEIAQTSARAEANVLSDQGSAIAVQGFVYSPTSVNPDPTLGGTGVIDVPYAFAEIGPMSANFLGLTPGTQYSVKAYASNGNGTGYTAVATFTTLSQPIVFNGSYAEAFNNFTSSTSPSLAGGGVKAGWTAISSGGIQSYIGSWTDGSAAAGFYGGVSNPGVLGYQPTATSPTVTVTCRMVNNTGGTITQLYVRYLGRAQNVANTRTPSWIVNVGGASAASLDYSTAGGVDETKSALVSGLSVAAGAEFQITWTSDQGPQPTGGTFRRIGLADFIVSTSPITSPTISVSGSLSSFSATAGTASASQSFTAGGTGISGDITVTSPTDYQVSLDNSAFASSVVIPSTNGTVSSTPVYVRIAATAPVGNPAGQVSLTSSGATAQNIAVTGTVSSAGQTFATWSGGLSNTPTLQLQYAIGGATSPTATNGVPSVTTVTSNTLSITAVVRTNDPTLTVNGQTLVDLVAGSWTTNGVTMTPSTNQAPEGCQFQIFSTPRGADGKKFLRLQTILPASP